MLMMQYRDGRCGPVMICDACQQRIVDATKANVLFRKPEKDSGVDLVEVFHAHKGKCDAQLEQRISGREGWCSSEEIDHWYFRLLCNTRVDASVLERAKRDVELLERLP